MTTTAVLGGGISGLSAGYYLLRRFGKPLTIYEASPRVGGWIRTEWHKERGFIFETGPRTIRPKGVAGANTLELVEQLKLPVKPIRSSHVAARNRMLYAKGQVCMLPNSPKGLIATVPPFTKPLYRALLHDLTTGGTVAKNEDESIYSFAERRFGKEIADYAISPMICGICAGDAREISVRFLMDSLFEKEQKYGGVIKGVLYSRLNKNEDKDKDVDRPIDEPSNLYKQAVQEKWAMYSLTDGLEQLPRALRKYLGEHDVNVQLSSRCNNLSFSSDGARLGLRNAELPVSHVVSSLPAYQLAPLVRQQHPSLCAQLLEIPYVDVVVVNLQYNSDQLLKQNGFGLLVPPVENLPVLGVIFDSCCFDMAGNTILTVMMGGKWFEQWFGHQPSQKELRDTAQQHVRKILNIKEEPTFSRVHLLHKCIPQYTVGHKRRVQQIRDYIRNYKLPLSLCGAAYDGVGINDVILSARRQVELLPMPQTH
ncbi:protoporphyrinogen oxidase [Drosophila grimshawi]|uniref:Protoporphyrinogen oxidase n=1 Tax=Drosophila grimshawi TaxID=7222 RepID=B4JEJ4_DROGR|nr:protoporphyrinogen oxidase [Drosophila grimshawi]EDV93125.1 GH19131 [Drosophila grimshawi]